MRLLPMVLVALVACAKSPLPSVTPASPVTPASSSAKQAPKDLNVITAAEFEDPSVQGGDALAAIRHLRPSYFQTRPSGSIQNKSAGSVHVSIDGSGLQAVSELSRYRVNELAEVRYLSANDAAQRFGTASGGGGVILVKTR